MRVLPRTVKYGETTYRVLAEPLTGRVRLMKVAERLAVAEFDKRLRTGALRVLDRRFRRPLDDDFVRLLGRPVPDRPKVAP